MKGLRLFGWMSFIVVGFLMLLFAIIFLSYANPPTLNPIDIPDKIQAIASILTLLFGTAAAVGGAIATIQVASLGLEISERQESRDSAQFIDNKSAKTITLFSELLVSLSNVYSSATILDVRVPHLEKTGISEQLKSKAPQELQTEMLMLSEKLQKLNSSIIDIIKDDFSHYCYQKSASRMNSKLTHINQTLSKFGVAKSELALSIESLSDLVAIIELASKKLAIGNMGDIIQARIFTNSSDTDLFKLSYENRNVRSFLFLGNLIFARSDKDDLSGLIYIASYGAAIINDLLQAIPDGNFILECITSRYLSIAKTAKDQKIFFNPTDISSKNILSAINDIESIGDLYLLMNLTR